MLGGYQRALKGSAHKPKEMPAQHRLSHAGRTLRLAPQMAGLWCVLTWGCTADAMRGTNPGKPPSRGKGDIRDSRWKVPSLLHGKLRQPVKWKSLSCLTICNPMDSAVHGILQARILEWIAFPFSRGSSQPRDRTQVSHTAGFTSWATRDEGKHNTGVGSLSLLQQIFPTQGLNPGLLHSRWTLY